MPKIDTMRGSLDMLVFKILFRGPRLNGYAIMTAIGDLSEEILRAEEGSGYPELDRMEEAEWVKKNTGRRARIHELIRESKRRLGVKESCWLEVSTAINRVLRRRSASYAKPNPHKLAGQLH